MEAQNLVSKTTGPPAFFLRDMSDGLCLAGNSAKPCALDTLWYVTGKPGSYQMHSRPVAEDEDLQLCFGRSACHSVPSPVQVGSCSHCGTHKWNILGDAETGMQMFFTLHFVFSSKRYDCCRKVIF